MKFSVNSEAAQWFIKELDLKPGGAVKIFTKIYGGIPTVYPSFFLGIAPGVCASPFFGPLIELKMLLKNFLIP